MGHMSYNKVSSSSSSYNQGGCRGFRLNPRKFYVLRLRNRFRFFLKIFDSVKVSYGEALQVLKKVFCRKSGFKRNNSSSRRSLVREEQVDWKMMRSYGRSNSFYAEAIEDCLEFIKRTSVSSKEQIQDPINHIQLRDFDGSSDSVGDPVTSDSLGTAASVSVGHLSKSQKKKYRQKQQLVVGYNTRSKSTSVSESF